MKRLLRILCLPQTCGYVKHEAGVSSKDHEEQGEMEEVAKVRWKKGCGVLDN